MKTNTAALAFLASTYIFTINAEVFAAEPMQCISRYHSKSSNEGPAPGTLATRKDTPCRLSRRIGGKGGGTHEAGGMDIVKAPKNGKVEIESLSSLVFTPRTGFTGEDLMVIRMKTGSGKGGIVRFVITVD